MVIWYSDDGARRNCIVLGESVLDLGGVHVLTTGNDHVLDAVDDEHVAALVHVAIVAGVHHPSRTAAPVSSGRFQ